MEINIEDYWVKAFLRAAAATKQTFGINREQIQKKVSGAFITIATWLLLFAKNGLPEVTQNLGTYIWYAAALLLVAFILFVWNLIEVQAKMFLDYNRENQDVVGKLNEKIGGYEERLAGPNYDAIRHQKHFYLYEAACLWVDLAPQRPFKAESARAWFRTLKDAIRRNELSWVNKPYDYHSVIGHSQIGAEITEIVPDEDTVVDRDELKFYAESHGGVPKFLRDS